MADTDHKPATDELIAGDALLPCPFCGGQGKLIHPMGEKIAGAESPPYYGPRGSRIVCTSPAHICCAYSPSFHGDDQDDLAIAAWNTRAGAPGRAPPPDGPVTVTQGDIEAASADMRASIMRVGSPAERWARHRIAAERAAFTRIAKLEAENARLLESMTPSAETKAAYIGEFSFTVCRSDDDGGEIYEKVLVPWTTIKDIMAAIRTRALSIKETE